MAEQHDQLRDYRSGKYTSFNMEWYDELRSSKPNWSKVSNRRSYVAYTQQSRAKRTAR